MPTTRKRAFIPVAAAFAFSGIVTGCGSSAPVRPAALDPSNPDAQESPPAVARPDAAATPATSGSAVNAERSPETATTPMSSDQHHHGDGPKPGK